MAARGWVRVRCATCRKAGIKEGFMLGDKRICKHKDEPKVKNYLAGFPRRGQSPETCTCDNAYEATQWIAKATRRHHKNPDIIKRTKVPFPEVALEWLEEKKKNKKLGIRTFSGYESSVKIHIIPAFKNNDIDNITPAMCKEFRSSLQDQGISNQQKISMRFNAILRKAAFDGLITEIPTKNLEPLPRASSIGKYNFWETSHIRDFMRYVTDPFFRLYYKLPIYCGLRAGEVAGLMWDCVNYEEKFIEIKRVLVWLTKKQMQRSGHPTPWMIKLAPKTESGFRRIPIDDNLAKELQIFKIEQPENRFNLVFAHKKMVYNKKAAFDYPDEPMPINPGVMNPNFFKDDIKNAGVPKIKYHELRHTYCSLCFAAGIEEYLTQYYMGHKDAALTRGIYRHLSEEKKRQGAGSAQKIANLIDPKTAGGKAVGSQEFHKLLS